ncbi:Hypothetical protein A7982_06311 [Minicystis rosea]|nr:Hypothetical protein A7982_06311 [Minicystis rosea]
MIAYLATTDATIDDQIGSVLRFDGDGPVFHVTFVPVVPRGGQPDWNGRSPMS